jgi:DNA polymerase III delta prime subunit
MTSAASLILDAAQRGDLHHAVILHGPSAAELRELGLRVAQTLNCLGGGTGDDCSSCSRIARGTHPDVHVVGVAADRKMIAVEQIRTLLADAPLRPYEGRNKVFIIDGAETVSPGGSNALLKTLEEPTRDTHFVLLTRSADLLLPTIRSRSQSIYVGPAARAATRASEVALAGESEEDGALLEIIEQSLGDYATAGDAAALLRLAAAIGQSESPKGAIALLAAVLAEAAGAGSDRSARLSVVRSHIPVSTLLAAADSALKGTRWIVVNADARLLAEQALAYLVR